MFDKFGEFDSVEELNRAAAGFLAEGDMDSLRKLAEENGIDAEDAEDYIGGYMDELASIYSAALGRLAVEEQEIEKKTNDVEKMPLRVILNMVRGMCTDQTIAAAVMRKGKRISAIYAAMREGAQKHKSGNMGISCGTDRDLQGIIRSYYLQTEKELQGKIEALYR